jgi:hypothetical protein
MRRSGAFDWFHRSHFFKYVEPVEAERDSCRVLPGLVTDLAPSGWLLAAARLALGDEGT